MLHKYILKSMKLCLVLVMPFVFMCGNVCANNISRQDEYIALAEQAIHDFQVALKTELMAAMAKGGAVSAVHICNEKAPKIAANLSAQHRVELRRTSLRWRNPANAPSAEEKAVLDDFEHKKGQGAEPAALHASFQTSEGLRYMKAIPMQGMCAACHGKNIDPKLYQAITSYYPDDKAIGFQEGDIRGAFSVLIKTVATNTSHDNKSQFVDGVKE